MDRLLLIDGHSVAYRAFFALPVDNFATSTGQSTNAVFGFTSMLINVLRDEKPTHVAVAFDVSRQSFRTEEYPEYKATRSASPAEFKGQVELIKQVLDALGIIHVEKPGFEADDIIATLSTSAAAEGLEVCICTGDRDALQLVTDAVTVLYPKKGVSELARMTPAAIEAKYGVSPAHYRDLAALVGETSDNLPGVPGVGPKTAAKWITAYDGLDNIVAQVSEIPGKAGESLRDNLDNVLRNQRLNLLVRDLELPVGPDDLRFSTSWNTEAVHEVFDALEFSALRKRLFDYLGGPEPEAASQQSAAPLQLVTDVAQLPAWLDEHGQELCAVYVCGALGPNEPRTDTVTIAGSGGQVLHVDVAALTPQADSALSAWLGDASRAKVLHDAKASLHALLAQGWTLAGIEGDTALAAYLLRPDQRSYDVADLAQRHLRRDIGAHAETGQLAFDDDTAGADEAGAFATAIRDLWDAFVPELEAHGALELLQGLELPLSVVLRQMESVGIAVDTAFLASLHEEFTANAQQAESEAFTAIGRQVNLGSPKQLQEVLFNELHMPKTKRTKTGWTTDAEALQQLWAKRQHPFLAALLAHRDVTKLRQTIEGLQKAIGADSRIHTTYYQTIAATGRLSSADPNLQNIPVRTESGRRIREAFCVSEGFDVLLTADYSQIEMRIMADLSGDDDLIEAFKSGEDFHTVMAARVFAREPADIDSELRARIKAMNYGLAYGLSAYGLSQQLGVGTGEAQALMDDYFETFGGVRDYLHGVVEEARKTGFTETIMGRRRYLPDLHSDNRQRREMAERMALNAPIQGSAADIIKVAMLNVDKALSASDLASRMLLQVHDELVLEVAKGELEVVTDLVRQQMGAAANLRVPLDVSIGTGRTWHEAAH